MDTQIMEKLQLAQMIVDILERTTGRDKRFIYSCVEQLLSIRNDLDRKLKEAKGDAFMNEYVHMASMIDKCNHTISKYAYAEEL